MDPSTEGGKHPQTQPLPRAGCSLIEVGVGTETQLDAEVCAGILASLTTQTRTGWRSRASTAATGPLYGREDVFLRRSPHYEFCNIVKVLN